MKQALRKLKKRRWQEQNKILGKQKRLINELYGIRWEKEAEYISALGRQKEAKKLWDILGKKEPIISVTSQKWKWYFYELLPRNGERLLINSYKTQILCTSYIHTYISELPVISKRPKWRSLCWEWRTIKIQVMTEFQPKSGKYFVPWEMKLKDWQICSIKSKMQQNIHCLGKLQLYSQCTRSRKTERKRKLWRDFTSIDLQ